MIKIQQRNPAGRRHGSGCPGAESTSLWSTSSLLPAVKKTQRGRRLSAGEEFRGNILGHLKQRVLVPIVGRELVNVGRRLPEQVRSFWHALGDLAEDRIPPALAASSDSQTADGTTLDLRSMRYKLIVCLREDFLPDLEGWRRTIPSLGRTRVRLLPMISDQALAGVHKPAPHLLDERIGMRIVRFAAAEQLTKDGLKLHPST
jgi:hypothetical protein